MTRLIGIKHTDGPEPRAEPGIQDILVLTEIFRLERCVQGARLDQCGFCIGSHHKAAVGQIISRYALAPPELAGYAPVTHRLHPVTVCIAVFVWNEFHVPALYACKGLFCQVLHLEEPLGGEFGLDDCVCALTVADWRYVILCLDQIARLFQHLLYLLAGFKAVFTHQDLSLLVQAAVVVYYIKHLQIMAEAYFVVVYIVCRGNLQAPGTEVHLHIIILDNRYLFVDERDEHILAVQPEVPFVLGIDADCGIGHNGLGTGGCNHQELVCGIAVTVADKVAKVIELALGVAVDNLFIADSGQAHGIPVHHTGSTVDITLVIEIAESVDHRLAQLGIHCKLSAVPVAACAKFAQLFEDYPSVLFFPLPGVFEELLAGDVFFPDAFLAKTADDFILCGYGCVVGAGHPAGILAVHTRLAYEHIVYSIVEHVSHMQDSRNIWRGNHYGIWLAAVRFRMKKVVVHPIGVPLVFYTCRVVFGFKLHLSVFSVF